MNKHSEKLISLLKEANNYLHKKDFKNLNKCLDKCLLLIKEI